MINEVIAFIELAEVNSNWSKITIKKYIYNKTDGWFITRVFISGYNQVTISGGPFQSGGTSIMAVDKVSCRAIATGPEFRNLGLWLWMLLLGTNNIIKGIITA